MPVPTTKYITTEMKIVLVIEFWNSNSYQRQHGTKGKPSITRPDQQAISYSCDFNKHTLQLHYAYTRQLFSFHIASTIKTIKHLSIGKLQSKAFNFYFQIKTSPVTSSQNVTASPHHNTSEFLKSRYLLKLMDTSPCDSISITVIVST